MPEDIYEDTVLKPVVFITQGTAEALNASFTFNKGKTELANLPAKLDMVNEGGRAFCVYTAPKVPDRDENYPLTWNVECNGKKLEQHDDYLVWPLSGKLSAVNKEDGKALKGFRFKVMQLGKQTGPEVVAASDDASAEFRLDKGTRFTVEAVPPYEIIADKSENGANGRPGRIRKVEAKLNWEAEFIAPLSTADVKQQVNLTTAANGRDGKGCEVTIQVGVKGDRDKAEADRLGKAGMFVYIHVTFGAVEAPAKKSKRNKPKTELLDGLNLKEKTAVTDGKEYKGKVELAAAGGIGEFKLNLGMAGGDTCTIEIGSTTAYGNGAPLKFINWRKLSYELMYPELMKPDLPEVDVGGGKKLRDLPTAVKQKIDSVMAPCYITYEVVASTLFTDDKVDASRYEKAAFFAKAGRDNYVMDYDDYGKADPVAFASNDKLIVCIRLCDELLDLKEDNSSPVAPLMNVVEKTFGPNPNRLFLTNSLANQASSVEVTGCLWKAKLAAGDRKKMPTLEFATADAPDPTGAENGVIVVTETLQAKEHRITFTKPLIGHISTSVSAGERATLETFVKSCLDPDTLRTNQLKVNFKLVGEVGNDRRILRFTNVKAALTSAFDGNKAFVIHPGADASGNPRQGSVDAAWFKVESQKELKVTLPKRPDTTTGTPLPGDFVGALSLTTCPVEVEFGIEMYGSLNGCALGTRQIMKIRPVSDAEACKAAAKTFCHELGHSMGMTIMAGDSKVPPGMDAAKNVDEGGVYYLNGTPDKPGKKGLRNCHVGPHCATGLPDLTLDTFAGLQGTCIIFGEGGPGDLRDGFCAVCVPYLRGRKLTDLATDWSARADEDY